MDTIESTLKSAVQSYLDATKDLANEQSDKKAVREQKKAAKQQIIDLMVNGGLSYINVDGTYIVIKQKLTKPCMNAEFVARAYVEFHKIPEHLNRPVAEAAELFGVFLFDLQKKLCDPENDLKITTKPPLCAMLAETYPTTGTTQATNGLFPPRSAI